MCKDCGCEEGNRRAYFGDDQGTDVHCDRPRHDDPHDDRDQDLHEHSHAQGLDHSHRGRSCDCEQGPSQARRAREDWEDRWEGRRAPGGPPRGDRPTNRGTVEVKLPEIHIHLNLGELGATLASPGRDRGPGDRDEGGRGRHRRGPGRPGCHHHDHGEDHEHPRARGHRHEHPHDHEHPQPHEHGHAAHAPQDSERRSVEVEQRVLAHNDALAAENRRWLSERGVASVNLISSPGSGKTELLVKTLEGLKERGDMEIAVLVGDQQTDNDARRLDGKGARVQQIETLASCHLNAAQIAAFLPEVLPELSAEDSLEPARPRLLFVENVGNLVCPAAFDLGEERKIALLSVTEGEDKPLKYPVLFHDAPVAVITKIDLLPHLDVDLEAIRQNLRKIRPDVRIFELSAKTGEGLDEWLDWLVGLPQALDDD